MDFVKEATYWHHDPTLDLYAWNRYNTTSRTLKVLWNFKTPVQQGLKQVYNSTYTSSPIDFGVTTHICKLKHMFECLQDQGMALIWREKWAILNQWISPHVLCFF